MGTITFNGLASGLDSSSMIDQLVKIERSAADTVTTKKTNLDSQKSIINTMSSALSSLATAARAMDLDTEVKPRTATVSDSRVAMAVSAGATPGVHDIRVGALAAAQVTQSNKFSSSAAGAAGAGGLDITVNGTKKSIAWTASDSLDAIATKINSAEAGVTASVVKVDDTNYRLVIAAKDTGTKNAATFTETGTPLGLTDPANVKVAAANAQVTVDGIDIERPTNVIADALTGVTLTLNAAHATTDPSSKATVSLDQTALTDKVKKLVDAFNVVNSSLHTQLDYTGTKKGENTLFGDSTLRGLQTALGTIASNKYGDSTLSDLGITRDKTGAMTLDSTKLAAAVAKDPDALSKVFVTNGFAKAITDLADRHTKADGIFATKTQSLTDRQKVMQTQIDRINKGADDLQARLEKQFTALETAISKMKSDMNYFASLSSS
ncbi:MAG: flagellar filament capping protein FliD [Kofleriaceae bacterium]|nr:flagellar filament capping protein FliD [Kofleriaceae bacterium]